MTAERLEQLERLARLRADGMLTEQEFAAEKARLLTDVDIEAAASGGEWPRHRIWLVPGIAVVVGTALVGGALVITHSPKVLTPAVPAVAVGAPVTPRPAMHMPKPILAEPKTGCAGRACRILTARGWAGIEAGMRVARAQKTSGLELRDDGHYEGIDAPCRRYEVVGGPSAVSMLVEEGVVTSLSVGGQNWQTDRRVKIGDPESAVRKIYKPLHQEPDIYGEAGDKMLSFDTERGKFGFVFGITKGRVSSITVGGSSRGYVEGCL